MNKQLHPNFTAVVFGASFLVVIALILMLPITIEIRPASTAAQEQTGAGSTGSVVEYTLGVIMGQNPGMAFIGIGGDIDGELNPTLTASTGDTVQITLINSDPIIHDLTITEFNVTTGEVQPNGAQATISFVPTVPGDFAYFCNIPGHRQLGMVGVLRVTGEVVVGDPGALNAPLPVGYTSVPVPGPADPNAVSIVRNPADVPPPVGDREPTTVRVALETVELVGQLADGTTYSYFTFNGTVPGPMIRIRLGDTVELTMTNASSSVFPHSIDLHAVTGPGGGAVYTQTLPGESSVFTFQALNPGLYVYHCATQSIPHHISNGMYGLILVEPEGGMPPVDREFYVMQGELYTAQPFGTAGHLDFSHEAMLDEDPEFFVFNGAVGGLTSDEYALRANVGETVRIYFGVGGPNFTSSFHVIGEIFDRVYDQASLTSPALTDVQTTLVPTGGATIVEFTVDVPGRYILVDHSLSRLERGLVGFLYVEGAEDETVFSGTGAPEDSGH